MPSGARVSASPVVGKRRKSHSAPALPPAPLPGEEELDEDISSPRRSAWRESPVENNDVHRRLDGPAFLQGVSASGKNKGKQRMTLDVEVEEEAEARSPGPIDSTFDPAMISIEPLEDDEAETRRVEENLRRWEREERQQRKAARASASMSPGSGATTQGPSLVGEVANYLWPARFSVQQHTALRSQESMDVPLTELGVPSPLDDSSRSPTPTPDPDPFANPSPSSDTTPQLTPTSSTSRKAGKRRGSSTDTAVLISPFDDAHQVAGATTGRTRAQPLRLQPPPPPRPLGLPPPRTPPPVFATSPTSATLENANDDVRPTRWWHEWLCGCGEGPDRGGDHQAGRTNPFE